MKRPFSAKVVTANHLISGEVVYLTTKGDWSNTHRQGDLITDQQQATLALALAQTHTSVVGAYLADAVQHALGPAPIHPRERFRASGPSNYRHGKQEAAHHV